jgi:hypothetical protein
MIRLFIVSLFLTSCSDIYRYPCQNPDNWDHKVCKKPYCNANGTCPEDLTPYEKERVIAGSKIPAQTSAKDCK